MRVINTTRETALLAQILMNETNNGGCHVNAIAPMLLVASGPVRVSMAIPETGSITAMNLLVIPVATVPKTVMKPALTVAVRHVARVILLAARLTRIVLVFVSSVNVTIVLKIASAAILMVHLDHDATIPW